MPRLNGINVLSYLGVLPLSPPNLVVIPRNPISGMVANADYKTFNIGDLWINNINMTVWILVSRVGNNPLWLSIGGAAIELETITGNDAIVIHPIANNINFLTANTTVQFLGNNGTATETLNFGITNLLLGSYGLLAAGVSNVGLGQGALGALTTGNRNTAIGVNALVADDTPSDNTAIGNQALEHINGLTLAGNFNTAVGSLALAGNLVGSNNIAIGYNAGSSTINNESSNILIGASGTVTESNAIHIGTQGTGAGQQNTCYIAGIANVAVPGTKNVVTINTLTGQLGSEATTAVGVTMIGGNTGTATPVAGLINIETANATPTFVAAGNTVTLDFARISNLILGSLPAVAGNTNTGVGYGTLGALANASNNTALGAFSGSGLTNATLNTFIGYNSGVSAAPLTTGSGNTAIGANSLSGAYTGSSSNIAIGNGAGSTAQSVNRSGNIYIGNVGADESNAIRIGTFGTQTTTYLAGVAGVVINPANIHAVTIDTTTGQMGSTATGAGPITNVTTTASVPNFTVTGSVANINYGVTNLIWGSNPTANVGFTAARTTGIGNTTLAAVTTGTDNVAIGDSVLSGLTNGNQNTAIGSGALANLTTGATAATISNNIAIGFATAGAYTTLENNNIIIGNPGVAGDVNIVRIGTPLQINGVPTATPNVALYMGGLVPISGVGAAAMSYNSNSGQMGTISSSIRYKEDVQDIEDDMSILQLRPVTYVEKNDSTKTRLLGLIAEEVDKILPILVARDHKGEIESVHYHLMPTLLLKEIQKLNKRLEALEARLQ